MVSIVLLTTEEVLQRNGFWYCLDTVWITEEMEPFEEVKPEHLYSKPLSRDFYYAKFPEIARSESEDENSISLKGFRSKHSDWKAKICIKKFNAQRRNSTNSRSGFSGDRCTTNSVSINDETRRVTSLVERKSDQNSEKRVCSKTSDERVREFFVRLLKNVPPPPTEDLHETDMDMNSCSITKPPKSDKDFNDIDLPDYYEFEKNKMLQSNSEQSLAPATSTLKRSKRRVNFNLDVEDFENRESWYESIYGVSDLVEQEDTEEENNSMNVETDENKSLNGPFNADNFVSWSEIINECGVNNSFVQSKDSLLPLEEIVSKSHCEDANMEDLLQEIDDSDDSGYAKFAIYKIHQTLKLDDGMIDSSSMKNLNCEEDDYLGYNAIESDALFYETMYRLAPKAVEEVVEPVNSVTSNITKAK